MKSKGNLHLGSGKKFKTDRYYLLWIEGLSPENGEKIAQVFPEQEYTHQMTKAMRFKKDDLGEAVSKLIDQGICEREFKKPETFIETFYAPKNTTYKKHKKTFFGK